MQIDLKIYFIFLFGYAEYEFAKKYKFLHRDIHEIIFGFIMLPMMRRVYYMILEVGMALEEII